MIARQMFARHTLAFAFALTMLLGTGPVGSDLLAQDQYVVAVLPFTASDEGDAKDLQEKIIAELSSLALYTLVEQEAVLDAIEGNGGQPGSTTTDASRLEVARGLDANIVAFGTLQQQGGDWVAEPVFVDVATRTTQDLGQISGGDIDDLGEQIVQAFNTRNQAIKHVIFGRDYVRSQNYDRAITNFRQALDYDPELAGAYYYIGQTYLETDSLNQALAALEKAIEIDPAYISAYHSIGQTYLEKGDTTQARNFFEQLVRAKADDCDIQIAYGYVMANQLGEVDKGMAAFEKAKSLCPENPAAYQYLAYALPNDRRDAKIDNFKTYLELSEGEATDPEALEYLFGLYFAEEQYQEAKATITQALAADPANADLHLYAGVVEDKLGNYQAAIVQYTQALEINPELERAYLYRALAHREVGNMTAFANDIEKAGRGSSSEILANIFVREAALSLKQGRTGPALEALNRASQLGGGSCAIAYYRGDAYYQMGKALEGEEQTVAENERARSMFNQAIASLRNACGEYSSYGQGLIQNSNQYLERIELIIKKKSSSSSR